MKNLTIALLIACPLFFLSACSLDKPVLPKKITSTTTGTGTDTTKTGTGTGTGTTTTGGSDTAKSGYYIKGTLGGKAFDWEVTNNTSGWVYINLSASGTLVSYIGASTTLQPQFGIQLGGFTTDSTASAQAKSANFNSVVTTGAWPYITGLPLNNLPKFIIVNYIDANGNGYNSMGPQTGSTATIISVTKVAADAQYNESLKIKLSLSCILYPADGKSATITLTGAEATVRLENLL